MQKANIFYSPMMMQKFILAGWRATSKISAHQMRNVFLVKLKLFGINLNLGGMTTDTKVILQLLITATQVKM